MALTDLLKRKERQVILPERELVTGDDIEKAIKQVVQYVKTTERAMTTALEKVVQELNGFKKKLDSDTKGATDELRKKTDTLFVRDRMETMHSEMKDEMQKILRMCEDKIKMVRDGAMGPRGADGAHGKDGSPDTPEMVRNKLERLRGKERLNVKAIEGLSELLENLSRRIAQTGSMIIAGGSHSPTQGSGSLQTYDLSGSLDGATKTFSLPAFASVLWVFSSSAPTPVMISSDDYTVDNSTMQITFGASVDETTTLAAGQRILVIYVAQG